MNAFLRGFTKVFSGNFYVTPYINTQKPDFLADKYVIQNCLELSSLDLFQPTKKAKYSPTVRIELIEEDVETKQQELPL